LITDVKEAEKAAKEKMEKYLKEKNFVNTRFVNLIRSTIELSWNLENSK